MDLELEYEERRSTMEHNPYITMNDGTEITRSDVKYNSAGEEYITIYFETPTENGFSSMDIDYPNGNPTNIVGYSEKEIDKLLFHYNKIGELAFEDAKEDVYARCNS